MTNPIIVISHLLYGLYFHIPLCCIINFCIDISNHQEVYAYRCSQFGLGDEPNLPLLMDIEYVPCRFHMKKILRTGIIIRTGKYNPIRLYTQKKNIIM